MVEKAKLLGEDLLLVVRSEFEKASAAHNAGHGASYGMPMGGMGMGGPPGAGFGGGGYGGPQQQQQQGGYYGYQQAQQPPQPQGDAPPPPPGDEAPPPPPDDGSAPPAGAPPAGGAAPAAGAPGGPTGPETAEQKAYREYWAAFVPLSRCSAPQRARLTIHSSSHARRQLRLRHQRPGVPGLAGSDLLRSAGGCRGRRCARGWCAWRSAAAAAAGLASSRRLGRVRRSVSFPLSGILRSPASGARLTTALRFSPPPAGL